METVRTISQLRAAIGGGNRCALVPTMGNLHDGHLSLVHEARAAIAAGAAAGPVVASIFVNRLQFGPNDDFDRYPRTFAADCDQLRAAGCDIVFAPMEADLYPAPQRYTVIPDPALAGILEGAFRPGFFDGVCTVVMKLFCCAQPALAVFGKKDYQQLMVVRRMVEQFALPIAIIGTEIARADDGLALSSRNGYLDNGERMRATALMLALRHLIERWRDDPAARESLERQAIERLTALGWAPDYLTIRRRSDLQPPTVESGNGSSGSNGGRSSDSSGGSDSGGASGYVALGAARIGGTRLIDNIEF
jgi:pantoate--beta-alanine ligase